MGSAVYTHTKIFQIVHVGMEQEPRLNLQQNERAEKETERCERRIVNDVTATCWYTDFYTKVCMMRQNTTVKTRRTDVIKRDVAPKFNESFSFKMMMMMMMMMAVVVYDDVSRSR